MNAMNKGYKSYDTVPHDRSPREIEAWGLLKSATALADAKANPDDIEGIRSALRANLVLWTIFQAAVMEDDCELPMDVRQNVYGLSAFVDKFTFKRLADLDVNELDFLIDMNRNIASGLMDGAGSDENAETAPNPVSVGGAAVSPPQTPTPSVAKGEASEGAQEALSVLGDLKV